MSDYKGMTYLKKKLKRKRLRVQKRYSFYEMKHTDMPTSNTIPPELAKQYKATLGWCGKAVDNMANRLTFRGFDNDVYSLGEIFEANNLAILSDSAILSALIASCCFIYIAPDGADIPRLQVLDGSRATGVIDPITCMLKEGYAVLEYDKQYGQTRPVLEAYFIKNMTYYYRNGKLDSTYRHKAEYPLLVPIIYRPDAVRPFGHSRISRACMYWQQYAMRTLVRSDISADFYSYPQRYVLGTDPESDPLEKWKAVITMMLEITKDEDGNKPEVGQFQQQSMQPHLDQLRTAAAGFAGETGLTLDDLGFVSDNPSSSEAIKAAHNDLDLTASKAQLHFFNGFRNAGYLARCVQDDFNYNIQYMYQETRGLWEPVFRPDYSAMAQIGDGMVKVNQAIPGYFGKDNARGMLGIDASNEPAPLGNMNG